MSTEFMLQLSKDLMEKRKVSETSANAYIRALKSLNEKKPFKTISFLRKKDAIEEVVKKYAPNTQKSLYTAISAVLALHKDKPTYKGIYKFYYDKMMDKGAELQKDEGESTEKTEKEEKNWIQWEDVQKHKKDLEDEVAKSGKKPPFDTLLQLVVLSLYTEMPPRRNQDFLDMVITRTAKDLPTDKNYLVLKKGGLPIQMIFNKYKTAKTYGQQIVDVPDSLASILSMYIKVHPKAKEGNKQSKEFPLLVSEAGVPLTAVNSITRILNKIFGKNVGSSMLRHIFLSSKYDVADMEKDAASMAHSMKEQRSYLRKADTTAVELPTFN